jgi:threonine/homoserine/homoserine lactone efflux protein
VLAWLGISAWRSARRGEALPEAVPRGRTPLGAFRASLLSIAANPKAAVFAFAFYPEFLPRHGSVLADGLALAVFQVLVIDTPYCAGIVLLADRARPWLSRAKIRRRMERAIGAVLVALGVELTATAH